MRFNNLDLIGMAMRKLSRRRQDIIRLRLWEHRGFREIGEILEISRNSAQRIYEKSIARIRREMGVRG